MMNRQEKQSDSTTLSGMISAVESKTEEQVNNDWMGRIFDGLQRLQSGQVLTQQELARFHLDIAEVKAEVKLINTTNTIRLEEHNKRLIALEAQTKDIAVDRNNTRWLMTLLAFASSVLGGLAARYL